MKSSLKIIISIIITASILLFANGCTKKYVISEKQTILFQFDFINYAWGFQHTGYMIDREGNILTYRNPEEWNFPDKDSELTSVQVDENIEKCKTERIHITKEELQNYTRYIEGIASSKVTGLKNVAADAGTSECICYLYSEDTGRYKVYLIKREGDFTCENLNFYTKKVALWMKDINKRLSE
jgi:hypothetical protein